jgi:hypothetical protein
MRGTMLIGDGWRDSDLYAILEQEWSGQPSAGRDGFSDRHGPFGHQLRSIVTGKLSSWCSINSIVVSNRPMRTMPFQ